MYKPNIEFEVCQLDIRENNNVSESKNTNIMYFHENNPLIGFTSAFNTAD
jgi:hypothetical protein